MEHQQRSGTCAGSPHGPCQGPDSNKFHEPPSSVRFPGFLQDSVGGCFPLLRQALPSRAFQQIFVEKPVNLDSAKDPASQSECALLTLSLEGNAQGRTEAGLTASLLSPPGLSHLGGARRVGGCAE